MRAALFVLLAACGGKSGDSGSTTSDPDCLAVWNQIFRTNAAGACYYSTGSGVTPGCYGCVRIRRGEFVRAQGDLVEIAEDPVTCSGGTFTQLGTTIATYDPTTGMLTVSDAIPGNYVLDDLAVCDGLQQM